MTPNLPPESSGRDQPTACFGEFRLNHQLRSLHRDALQLRLPAKPFATLEFLIENRRRVVPKSELLREVWGGRQEINTVEQAVRKVRKVLADDPEKPRYIETVTGEGYRFIAEVYSPPAAEPAPGGGGPRPSRRSLLIAACVGAPLVCLTGLGAFRLLHRTEPVARVAVNGTSLVAMSARGDVLWTYPFNEPLAEALPEESGWRTQIVDLDGDGLPEVLLVAAFASAPGHPGEIFCFSSAGKVLWHYRPTVDLHFNKPDLNGPWHFVHAVVVPGRPAATIWAAVAHNVWWPSFIVRLSAAGVAELVYVSSGVVHRLQRFRNGTGSYPLAAGVNNEYRQAALTILSESGPPATSPQTEGSEYQCLAGCPNARPYRYILLPRSELNEASGQAYNEAHTINLRPGGITVEAWETVGAETEVSYYDFSQDFEPERVAYGSGWRAMHEKFERDGRIKHRYKDCPERMSGAVLRICDEKGNWRRVTIPRLRPYE